MLAVVALDGGSSDRDVVAAAAFVLHPDRDEVRLLTVLDESEVEETRGGARISATLPQATSGGRPLPIAQAGAPVAEGRDQAIARVRSDHITYLEGLAPLLGAIPYKCVVEIGDPAEKIVELAKELDAGGIAMGTRSKRSRLRSAVFGSVAEEVVRTSPVPVLVVKEGIAAPPAEQTAESDG
jgi:nucleotide-binding universal stress UspA family protein